MNLWIDKKQIWAILILICIGAILGVVFRGMDTDPKKEILAVSRHFFSLIAISFAAGLFGVKPWWAGPALGIASLVVSVYQVAMSDAIMFGGPAGPIISFAYPWVIGGFIFTRGGTFIDPEYFTKWIAIPLVREATNGRVRRFHDLRHFFASMLIENGESAKYVQDQVGHASITTTFDTYGHLMPQAMSYTFQFGASRVNARHLWTIKCESPRTGLRGNDVGWARLPILKLDLPCFILSPSSNTSNVEGSNGNTHWSASWLPFWRF